MATPPTKPHIAHAILSRAHSPATANTIFRDRVLRQPLLLRASSPDARDRRRQHRAGKAAEQRRKRKQKPKPLSAKLKRALGVYDIPKEERKWEIYEPLRSMWWSYMREILGLQPLAEAQRGALEAETGKGEDEDVTSRKTCEYVTPAGAGPKIASADFHGAEVAVVRSRCVSRVGVSGIVVKDTKFTFEVITRRNELKTLPKEHTVFRFEIPLNANTADAEGTNSKPRSLVFELYGSQFENRAPERATRKFKQHFSQDL